MKTESSNYDSQIHRFIGKWNADFSNSGIPKGDKCENVKGDYETMGNETMTNINVQCMKLKRCKRESETGESDKQKT